MTHALYYPTIEFKDLGFLKRSLLVWDRVFRIVPTGYIPYDSSEVTEAVSEEVVVDITLSESDKVKAADNFLDFYRTRNSGTNILVWPSGLSHQSFTNLNPEKIDAKLLPLFEKLSTRFTYEGFMEVPKEAAGGYMFYLASTVANTRSLDLISDSPENWTVASFFANNGNFTEQVRDEDADTYLANMVIEDLLPNDLASIPIDKILQHREKNAELRALFQKELKTLRDEISRCNNKKHAQYIAGDFVKRFQLAKDEYRNSFSFFNKKDIGCFLSVGIPTNLSVFSFPAFASDPYSLCTLGAGLLIGSVAALAARTLIPNERSMASYLVASENLKRGSPRNLYHLFEEFIND